MNSFSFRQSSTASALPDCFDFLLNLFQGHVAQLLTSLLKVMYISSEKVTKCRRQRKGAYKALRKSISTLPAPLPVLLSVPLPKPVCQLPPIRPMSKNLYTVCVCLLIIVNNSAVRSSLSAVTKHPPWLREYLVNAHIRVRKRSLCSVMTLCF